MATRSIASGLAFAMLLLASMRASACQFSRSEPFADLMEHAAHISVVRVVSSGVQDGNANDHVVAQVQLIETLRGAPAHVRTLHYNNGTCAGNRIDVGHYFLLMEANDAPEVDLGPMSEAVLDLTRFMYLPPEAWARVHMPRNEIRELVDLRQAIAGKGKIPERYIEAELQYTRMSMDPKVMVH